ncbi:Sodium/proline symporter [Lacicoccus alkaliphilus]|uniref:Sodium/proline symporter n=2 Tax=Lacicoccus TaxID=3076172 RepID=A0A1M7G176_9BACL|nr:sodium/proline symporter [Salinicoccus alkaliphilus DSM 16010]
MNSEIVLYSWIFVVVFIGGMIALGFVGMKRTKDADDFATARSSYSPLTMALVIAAGIASGSTFMGIPGLAYSIGTPSLWYPLLYPIATVIGMMFVAKVIKKYGDNFGTRTIPEFIGERYNSEFLRIALSIISILLIFYVISQFVAAGTMFQTMLGVEYGTGLIITGIVLGIYVFLGGSHSDIITDAVQGFLMLCIAMIIFVSFFTGFGVEGGFSGMMDAISQERPEGDFNSFFLPGDMTYGAFWLVALLFIAHLPFSIQPHLGNKFMAVKDGKDMKKLLMYTTIFATFLPVMALGGMLGIAVVGGDAGIHPDSIIPVLFSELFPPIIAAFLAVAVLSAIMSTSDGLIVSLSQIVANDLFRKTIVPRINMSEMRAANWELGLSRYSTIVVIVLAVLFAWNPPESLAVFLWIGIGGIMAATAGPILMGALWKKATRTGAIVSLLVGNVVYWIVYLPIGIGFTNPFGASGIAVMVSILVMFVVSLMTGNNKKNQVVSDNG